MRELSVGGLVSVLLTALLVKFKVGLRPLTEADLHPHPPPAAAAAGSAAAAAAAGGGGSVVGSSLLSSSAPGSKSARGLRVFSEGGPLQLRRRSHITLSQSFR
jgi:hypothetical protein